MRDEKEDEYRNGGVQISGRMPTRFALAVLFAVVSGAVGYGGGSWLAFDAGASADADYYRAQHNARIAERRNAEWEACWQAFRRVGPVDDADCPPPYVTAGGLKR